MPTCYLFNLKRSQIQNFKMPIYVGTINAADSIVFIMCSLNYVFFFPFYLKYKYKKKTNQTLLGDPIEKAKSYTYMKPPPVVALFFSKMGDETSRGCYLLGRKINLCTTLIFSPS